MFKRSVWMMLALVVSLLSVGAIAEAATSAAPALIGPQPTLQKGPNFRAWGRYTESVADLKVKVIGGDITVWRTWADGEWQINRAWNPLHTSLDDASVFDPAVLANGTATVKNPPIYRNFREYTYAGAGQYTYLNRSKIVTTATGYRWEDHQGNWVDYDQQAKVVSYGDRNGTTATMVRDTQGRITGVKDVNGTQVLWYDYDATTGYLIAARDYTGRKVQYAYTTFTPPANAEPGWKTHPLLTDVTDVRGNVWNYTYDSTGRLATKTNPAGRKVTFTYSGDSRLSSMLDQGGAGVTYTYDYNKTTGDFYEEKKSGAGVVAGSWTDAKGDIIERTENGNTVYKMADSGRTKVRTDSAGNATQETFDEWDNLLTATYADGSSIKYTYDTKYSNVLSYTNENGVTTNYTYDTKGNLVSMVEAVGAPVARTTIYTRDSHGQILTARRGASAYTYTYDSYGNKTSVADPLGNKTTYTYDVMGNVLTRTDALGKVWTTTYDAAGNQLTASDPLGNTATYTYDAMGNQLTETDALNHTTTYTYDIRGDQISVTDAAGGIATKAYDLDGKLVKQTDAAGKSQTFTYDGSRIATITDGDGNAINYSYAGSYDQPSSISFPTLTRQLVYDSRNRVISTTELFGATSLISRVTYDKAGNRTSATDPAGRTTRYTYDALGRTSSATDAMGGVTSFAYDAFDNLLSVTDANGNNAFRYQYDAANRKVKELRPMGQSMSFAYDGEGRVTSYTDARGLTTTYTHDASGRPTAIHYPATNGFAAKTVTFTFDANDNLTGYSDGTTSGSYVYDALDRKTGESVNYGAFTLSSSYSYYANGRKKSFTGPDGKRIDYSYDAADLLQSITLPGQGSIVYNSYNWVAPSKVTLPGGSTKNFAYDGLLRVTDIHMKDPAANTLMHYGYTYDAAGNMTAKNTEYGAYSFAYDDLNRMTGANYPTLPNETFGYDKVGNRTVHNGDTVNPWAYNANNELTSRSGASYGYDANGSQVQKTEATVVTDYIFNAENRLAQVKLGTTLVAEYGYDPLGRRLSKTVNGATTYYYYADEGLVAEADGTGKVTTTYGYEPDSSWGTRPLYMSTLGVYDYYLNDSLGTPQQLVQSNGAKVWSAEYEAFGKAHVSANSTVINNLRFPGQYEDGETGLNYNLTRSYDPLTGRYTQADSVGLRGGLNQFVYVDDNPARWADPSGKFIQFIAWGYLRCLGSCLAVTAATAVAVEVITRVTTECEVKRNTVRTILAGLAGPALEACAVECLNPLNWFTNPIAKFKKIGDKFRKVNNVKKEVTWPTARKRYWKDRAKNAEDGEFSPENLDRMRKGKAPRHDELGVPKELHHKVPQRDGGSHDPSNLQEVWPWEHDAIDPYRHYNGPRPSGG